MKLGLKIRFLVPIVAAAVLVGCGKTEEAPPTVPAVQPVTESGKPAVQAATAAASSQADGLIAKAQSLITSKNYTEATNVLKELSSLKLTPEQQKLVDDLKAQVQKYMASQATSEATKAVGGLLK